MTLSSLAALVKIAGLLHLVQPISMIFARKFLRIAQDLGNMSPLGGRIFIVLLNTFTATVVSLGFAAFFFPIEFVNGNPLGMFLSAWLVVFFTTRFLIQIFYYRPYWPTEREAAIYHRFFCAFFLAEAAVYSAAFCVSLTTRI